MLARFPMLNSGLLDVPEAPVLHHPFQAGGHGFIDLEVITVERTAKRCKLGGR